MKLSDGVEWGAHCAVMLAMLPPGQTLPAARLAEYHGVPAAYLAKHLQALARAGILASVPGPTGGYGPARPPSDVTLLDVVEAIDGSESAFRCTEIRRRGPAAVPAREYRLPCSIHAAMDRADAAWRAELAGVTVADLVAQVQATANPKAVTRGLGWLEEVLR
ncbi:MAG TPA: Rrf2 family transcriptional regulator [Acidimicrobiia bacterium]|nr:Rrf2 family transcriptional regulator [Acidimicrobiia bacterium]